MAKIFKLFIVAAVLVSFGFVSSPAFAVPPSEPGAISAPAAIQSQAAGSLDLGPELTYGIANQSWFFLPAASFNPRDSAITFAYSGLGYIQRTGGSSTMFWAPLVVPAGARLNYIRYFYYDNSAQDLTVYISKFPGDTSPTVVDIENGSSSGTPGYASSFFALNETIRYGATPSEEQGYVVYVSLPDASSNMRFKGVVVFYQLQLSPAPATASFSDVPTSHPFFQYIEALYASGITTGYGGTSNFGPNDYVTRGQMAAFLARALGLHWAN
jgi:hypothetical protein